MVVTESSETAKALTVLYNIPTIIYMGGGVDPYFPANYKIGTKD